MPVRLYGIVHNDLKGENILVEATEGAEAPYAVSIIDFGGACTLDARKANGVTVCADAPEIGTPGFYKTAKSGKNLSFGSREGDLWALVVMILVTMYQTAALRDPPAFQDTTNNPFQLVRIKPRSAISLSGFCGLSEPRTEQLVIDMCHKVYGSGSEDSARCASCEPLSVTSSQEEPATSSQEEPATSNQQFQDSIEKLKKYFTGSKRGRATRNFFCCDTEQDGDALGSLVIKMAKVQGVVEDAQTKCNPPQDIPRGTDRSIEKRLRDKVDPVLEQTDDNGKCIFSYITSVIGQYCDSVPDLDVECGKKDP